MEAEAAATALMECEQHQQLRQPLMQNASRFGLARDGRESSSSAKSSLIEVDKLASGNANQQQQLMQPSENPEGAPNKPRQHQSVVVATTTTTKPTTKVATTKTAKAAKTTTEMRPTARQSINYWHYKQTGIKSRPIKLLKHPIEHIERKIIITYLLGFLFKLIAVVTGPIIVLAVYLMTVPFTLLRRSTWWLLNLSFTFDARIKTTPFDCDGGEDDDDNEDAATGDCCDDDTDYDDDGAVGFGAGRASETRNAANWKLSSASQRAAQARGERRSKRLAKQVQWNYCPLSYIEAYWFKEKLVNNVILIVNGGGSGGQVSIEKLRCLVRASILSKPSFRKFLSRVVAKGIPFYKGYYWHYLGLSEHCTAGTGSGCSGADCSDHHHKLGQPPLSPTTSSANRNDKNRQTERGQQEWSPSELASGSLSTIGDQFSVTSNNSTSTATTTTATNDYDAVHISILEPPTEVGDAGGLQQQLATTANKDSSKDCKKRATECGREEQVCLSKHIYLDKSLDSSNVTSASIRHHAYRLLGTGLDMTRPLWEIRLIKPRNNRSKSYLIFRCHQSLADGRSLTKILTDHLTELPIIETSGGDKTTKQKRVSPSRVAVTASADSLPFIDSSIVEDRPELRQSADNDDEDEDECDYDDAREIGAANYEASKYQETSDSANPQSGSERNQCNNFNGQSMTETSNRGQDNLKLLQFEKERAEREQDEEELELRPIREKRSFVSRVSKANSWRSAIFVGPLTVLLWVIWTFTRRKKNHLNKCLSISQLGQKARHSLTTTTTFTSNKLGNKALKTKQQQQTHINNEQKNNNNHRSEISKRPIIADQSDFDDPRRFYMNQYSLTKFYRIKQMTRSTVSDVILCGLSGALRDYLRKFNGISNPPNLNISLIVDMRQPEHPQSAAAANTSTIGSAAGRSSDLIGQQQRLEMAASVGNTDEQEGAYQAKTVASLQQCDDDNDVPMPPPPQVNCTLVNVPLPTSVEGTVPRLWELRNTMDELRTSADPWVMLGLQRILFTVLPSSWYQRIINYIALRNSSTFVSNIRGPKNMVESWCVDLLQRAIFEAQQPPRSYRPKRMDDEAEDEDEDENDCGGDGSPCSPPNRIGQSLSDKPFETSAINNRNCSASAVAKRRAQRLKAKQRRQSQLKFSEGLGSISAIYYCMQPPTSDIPISFNCITYHDRLYVTALSRSLLVEDSKLLIRLFFKQLNQLADTIAKRKSLVTIIRTPVPIEISCEPASPLADGGGKFQIVEDEAAEDDNSEDDRDFIVANVNNQAQEVLTFIGNDLPSPSHHPRDLLASEAQLQRRVNTPPPIGQQRTISPSSSASLQLQQPPPASQQQQQSRLVHSNTLRAGVHKDDIEANFENVERTNRCQACRQTVCACRRRKSLFSFDSKQRAVNLLSLLHPSHFVALRTSRSNESQVELAAQRQNTIECLCGQRLLEELDEENPAYLGDGGDANEASSVGSRTPSDDGGRLRCLSARPCCAKCRLISGTSTFSLDATTSSFADIDQQQRGNRKHWLGNSNSYQQEHNLDYPPIASIAKQKGAQHASAQLIVPQDDRFRAKAHSKSETDLLPATMNIKGDHQAGSKESWLMIGRRSYRKFSVFSRSSNQQHQSTSSRNSTSRGGSNNAIATAASSSSRRRYLIDTSMELGRINRHSMSNQAKRRQSVATSTGVSYINRSVVVKDEINADVSLRYQLDTPFLGIRNRRFSAIGSAVVGNQRRSSLIPFGLMHNQSFPKLFWDDGEAHL